jgi:hypothetical protein
LQVGRQAAAVVNVSAALQGGLDQAQEPVAAGTAQSNPSGFVASAGVDPFSRYRMKFSSENLPGPDPG